MSPIHIVPQEQESALAYFTPNLQKFNQIRELAMHISADGEGSLQLDHIGLFFEDRLGLNKRGRYLDAESLKSFIIKELAFLKCFNDLVDIKLSESSLDCADHLLGFVLDLYYHDQIL